MEQNDKKLSNMQLTRYLTALKKESGFSDDVVARVKSDLEDGLTQEQTEMYLDKDFGIGQIRVLSDCLHNDVSDELFRLLHDNKLSGNQMKVSLEFYEKGVPMETIKECIVRSDSPVNMRKIYNNVLQRLEKAKQLSAEEAKYVKELIAQMEQVVEKINYQDNRYDELNKKLTEIESSKDDEAVRERLVREIEDKDAMINSQQDRLNQASRTVEKLRNEIEKKDKEIKQMSDRIESLEDEVKDAKDRSNIVADMENSQPANQSLQAIEPGPQTINGIPVYYQIPVVDSNGNFVQQLPVERAARKSANRGLAGLFARLSFRKKSRADIVRLVASGDLVPAQLVQIKSAIEKGLTESQLVELINNNISAEKMKEIIEIAVLENSLAD